MRPSPNGGCPFRDVIFEVTPSSYFTAKRSGCYETTWTTFRAAWHVSQISKVAVRESPRSTSPKMMEEGLATNPPMTSVTRRRSDTSGRPGSLVVKIRLWTCGVPGRPLTVSRHCTSNRWPLNAETVESPQVACGVQLLQPAASTIGADAVYNQQSSAAIANGKFRDCDLAVLANAQINLGWKLDSGMTGQAGGHTPECDGQRAVQQQAAEDSGEILHGRPRFKSPCLRSENARQKDTMPAQRQWRPPIPPAAS